MLMQRGIAKITIGKNGKKFYYEQLNPGVYSYWYRIKEYNFNWHIDQSKVGIINKLEYDEEKQIIFIDYVYDIEKWDPLSTFKHHNNIGSLNNTPITKNNNFKNEYVGHTTIVSRRLLFFIFLILSFLFFIYINQNP